MNIAGFFRKTKITFVKKEQEHGDVYSFYFSSKQPLSHIAGQHALFFFPGLKGMHIFSLSSAPEEDLIRITTHAREESAYKKRLMQLNSGDTMTLVGPVLDFVYPEDAHNVIFLAQGVGITPFRSLLVHAKAANLSVATTLIHVDSDAHTFQSETKLLARRAVYPADAAEFTDLVKRSIDHDAIYYISGSPKFVSATKQTLAGLGIAKTNMKSDNFIGY